MSGQGDKNIYWHAPEVTVHDRRDANDYRSCVLWFTGLSASGKSTLANALSKAFHAIGVNSYVLDGDNIRHGLNKDLGFSPDDRKENIRRIGEVSKLFVDAGLIVLTAFISPYREDRDRVRSLFRDGEFIEVHVKCPIEVCERRDPKGAYQRAKAGQIRDYTGISAPYEEPLRPELVIKTATMSKQECYAAVLDYLGKNGYLGSELARKALLLPV